MINSFHRHSAVFQLWGVESSPRGFYRVQDVYIVGI